MTWEPHALDADLAEGVAVMKAVRACVARGVRFNNLFQLDSGAWRCNLRSTGAVECYEFGDGASPSAAILAALSRVKGGGAHVQEEGQGQEALSPSGDTLSASQGEDAEGVFS
jgi:hypothetical protein